MLQNKKVTSKKDLLYISELTNESGPIDPFKKDRCIITKKKEQLANKIVDNVIEIKVSHITKS